MASVFDSIRSVMTCKFVLLKILFLSGLLAYPLYQVLLVDFKGWLSLWAILSIVMLIYNIGFSIYMVHNEVSDNTVLMPGIFNPLKYTAVGLGSLVFGVPTAALMWFLGNYIYNIGIERDIALPVVIIAVTVLEWILIAVLEIQTVLFSYKLNPFHSFNIVKIFKNITEFLTRTLALLLCYAVTSLFTVSIGILVTKIFAVKSFALVYYIVFILFFYILIGLYYFGQLYLETLYVDMEINYDENTETVVDSDLLD